MPNKNDLLIVRRLRLFIFNINLFLFHNEHFFPGVLLFYTFETNTNNYITSIKEKSAFPKAPA